MDKHLNKENINVKTRIPLPVDPLPPLPRHLLKKVERPPLKTLVGPSNGQTDLNIVHNTQNLAGPSNAKNKIIGDKPNSPYKVDTRFVTFKRGCEEHEDDRRKSLPTVICVNSDDDGDSNQMESCFHDKDRCVPRRASANTPALRKLQPARVRNIKRSLKRPHSRELQRISPELNRDKPDDDKVRRRLNFKLTLRDRTEASDYLQKMYMEKLNRDYTADIFSYLLKAEVRPPALPKVINKTRACVINWLMKINGVDGNPATIQTAIWFLDAVLASGSVALENMQLVAAASYWIASKIEGPVTPAAKLVRYSNKAFPMLRLLEAEKIILNRLKFPRNPVVPQIFLRYFAWRCETDRHGEVEVAATFLCLCGMMVDKSLCQEYPSVVAAASIRNALLLLRKKELMSYLQNCPMFVYAESKAASISYTCVILRRAVRTVASKNYSYNFLFEQYGTPPKYIAQTIVTAANELAVVDARSYDFL